MKSNSLPSNYSTTSNYGSFDITSTSFPPRRKLMYDKKTIHRQPIPIAIATPINENTESCDNDKINQYNFNKLKHSRLQHKYMLNNPTNKNGIPYIKRNSGLSSKSIYGLKYFFGCCP